MSHFTTMTKQIKDLAALRACVQELGLARVENAQARGVRIVSLSSSSDRS